MTTKTLVNKPDNPNVVIYPNNIIMLENDEDYHVVISAMKALFEKIGYNLHIKRYHDRIIYSTTSWN